MSDVRLSDLVDPEKEAQLRALVAGNAPPPDDELESKADAPVGLEHKADPGVGGAQVISVDDETGLVTALVSVTGVEDRVKDIIEPGAYTKTIGKHEPIGVWSHDDKTWVARTEHAVELMPGDPFFRGLKTMDGQPWPTNAGAVKVDARFNLETTHGREAYSDVKFFQGKTGWSIGYRATKAHRNPRTGVRHIKELDWFEYSPVMVGAASQPMTLAVKSLAQSVDPDAGVDLVDVESLTETEVKARDAIREFLETKATQRYVRTPEGAAHFGQPIGSLIIKDVVRAGDLEVGDLVDFQGMGPGGPSDPKPVKGHVDALKRDGNVVTVTVGGEDHKLGENNPVSIERAKPVPGGGPAPERTPAARKPEGPVTDGQLQKLLGEATTDEQRAKVREALKLPEGERRAFLAGEKPDRASRGGTAKPGVVERAQTEATGIVGASTLSAADKEKARAHIAGGSFGAAAAMIERDGAVGSARRLRELADVANGRDKAPTGGDKPWKVGADPMLDPDGKPLDLSTAKPSRISEQASEASADLAARRRRLEEIEKPSERPDTVDMSDEDLQAELTSLSKMQRSDAKPGDFERLAELSNERTDRVRDGKWTGKPLAGTPVKVEFDGEQLVPAKDQGTNDSDPAMPPGPASVGEGIAQTGSDKIADIRRRLDAGESPSQFSVSDRNAARALANKPELPPDQDALISADNFLESVRLEDRGDGPRGWDDEMDELNSTVRDLRRDSADGGDPKTIAGGLRELADGIEGLNTDEDVSEVVAELREAANLTDGSNDGRYSEANDRFEPGDGSAWNYDESSRRWLEQNEDGEVDATQEGLTDRQMRAEFGTAFKPTPSEQANARVMARTDKVAAGLGNKGTGTGSGAADDPVNVKGDIMLAAKLLAEGKHVRLNKTHEVGTLLDKLAENVRDAVAKGDKAPTYDLCKVSVPKTNLFCAQSKGIPRAQMPQLGGQPVPGSRADALPREKNGEVNIAQSFRDELAKRGIGNKVVTVKASSLKASQAELDGPKVAGMSGAMKEGKVPDAAIFVTKDGYIIDGHHRWASKVAIDAEDGVLGDVEMPVEMVDMEIGEALAFANAFALDFGIQPKGLGAAAEGTGAPTAGTPATSRGATGGRARPAGDAARQADVDSAREDFGFGRDKGAAGGPAYQAEMARLEGNRSRSSQADDAPATTPARRSTGLTKTEKASLADDLGLDTLETRNSDSLDFHEVGLDSLRAAAEKVYGGKLPANLTPERHEATAERVSEYASRGGSAADFPEFAVWSIEEYLTAVKKAAGSKEKDTALPGQSRAGSRRPASATGRGTVGAGRGGDDGEADRKREQRAQRQRDSDRAGDAEADARISDRAKLAALNKRRRARGQLPLLRLPDEGKYFSVDALDANLVEEVKGSRASLNRSPKENWIEKVGGELPGYVREVARSIEKEGHTLQQAIRIAIGRIRVWSRGGGNVKPDTVAKAQVAIRAWDALKAKAGMKFDSELLEEMEQKALDLEEQVEDAWAFLYEAGEVKAQVGTDEEYIRVDPVTGETVGVATVEDPEPVVSDGDNVYLSPDELTKAAELRDLLN